jgi:hypothetical protein
LPPFRCGKKKELDTDKERKMGLKKEFRNAKSNRGNATRYIGLKALWVE